MTELGPITYAVTRADLVAYAAASGDHNPIHRDPEVARSVGLPDVIAHGMYTLALAARYVDEQLGEPGRIVELGAKFTKPVVVPEAGTEVVVVGGDAVLDADPESGQQQHEHQGEPDPGGSGGGAERMRREKPAGDRDRGFNPGLHVAHFRLPSVARRSCYLWP